MLLWLLIAAYADRASEDYEEFAKYHDLPYSHKPLDVPRFSKLSTAEFENRTRHGLPFIVTDAIADWGLRNWTCDSTSAQFGNEWHMRFGGSGRRSKFARLREKEWLNPDQHVALSCENQSAASSIASFHWQLIDDNSLGGGCRTDYYEEGGFGSGDTPLESAPTGMRSPVASKAGCLAAKDQFGVPYFMRANAQNELLVKGQMVVFHGTPGSGAQVMVRDYSHAPVGQHTNHHWPPASRLLRGLIDPGLDFARMCLAPRGRLVPRILFGAGRGTLWLLG
jgi:hypothetical protein